MHTQETIEAVFAAILDPNADFLEAASELAIPITEFLKVAESPQITEAIEALEKLAALRERALLARASHTAIAALGRIADSDPETPGARETARKAAAQLLRMAAKAEAASPLPAAHSPSPTPAESSRPGEAIATAISELAHSPLDALAQLRDPMTMHGHDTSEPAALASAP